MYAAAAGLLKAKYLSNKNILTQDAATEPTANDGADESFYIYVSETIYTIKLV